MELMPRDIKLIEYIDKFKVIDVPHAVKLVKEYRNEHTARRRLNIMYNNKILKKNESHRGEYQVYYIKPVKQFTHRFLLIDFYSRLSEMCNILSFETEYKIKGSPGIRKKGDVICDALIKLQRSDGRKATFIVEVQQPFNPLNFEKYKGLNIPTIITITDKQIEKNDFDVIVIKTNFKNIKEVLE